MLLAHPDDADVVSEILEMALDGEPQSALVRARTSQGTYRVMSVVPKSLGADASPDVGVVVGLRDVDELVRQRELAEFEATRRRAILETLLDPHALVEAVRAADGRIIDFVFTDASKSVGAFRSQGFDGLIGARLSDVLHTPAEGPLFDRLIEIIDTGEPLALDNFPIDGFVDLGSTRYIDARAVRVGDGVSITWRDVTDRYESNEALAASEERYRLIAENAMDVVLRTHDNTVTWVSPSLTRTLGWSPEEWIGQSMARFGSPDDADVVDDAREQMRTGRSAVFRIRLLDIQYKFRWVEVHSQVFLRPDGTEDGFISTFRVVDTEVDAERQLQRQARFDDLTGALKRDPAIDTLNRIGSHPRVPGAETAILFVDIDNFKSVNDTWGHIAGDVFLATMVERIRATVRTSDTVARLGGDEFLIVLVDVHSLEEATEVAEKVRHACSETVATESGVVKTTVSIGVTLANPIESADDLVARADRAMYVAKGSGRNQVAAIAADGPGHQMLPAPGV